MLSTLNEPEWFTLNIRRCKCAEEIQVIARIELFGRVELGGGGRRIDEPYGDADESLVAAESGVAVVECVSGADDCAVGRRDDVA